MSLSEFFASLNQNGQLLAGLGAVFAALFAGIGSAIGVGHAGQAGAAVIAIPTSSARCWCSSSSPAPRAYTACS